MKQLENAASWCPYCDRKVTIEVTQPYRDDTYRVEFVCRAWDKCHEAGIVMLMEVKQ